MRRARRKSPYVKAVMFMLCVIVAGVACISILPTVEAFFGVSSKTAAWIETSLSVAWLIIGGIGILMIRCPNCGRSVFKVNGLLYAPWPAARCRKCDTDLVNGKAGAPRTGSPPARG